MIERSDTPRLTSDLGCWEIELTSGETMKVRAHGFGRHEGSYVFVALMDGDPPFEYELLRVPGTIVVDVDGYSSPPTGTPGGE